MDSSLHGITPLRQRMIDDMRMRKLAEKTQSGYIRVVRQFTAFLGRSPDTATVEDLRRHRLHRSITESRPSRLRLIVARRHLKEHERKKASREAA